MARISLDEAASRYGVSRSLLEEWAARGLLVFHLGPHAATYRCVDEEELIAVMESVGWLHISTQGWEGAEDA